MKQLEVRPYDRQEIAQILGVKLDSHNFIRDVQNKLDAWGYAWTTPRGGAVIITRKPETAEERLAEIMVRLFGLDIQIETKDFACYLDFMLNEPDARTMPWKLRHERIKEQYGMDISEITLRRWTARLIKNDVVFQSPLWQDAVWWRTVIRDGVKHQEQVPDKDRHIVAEYFQRRKEIYAEEIKQRDTPGEAWEDTYKRLWQEYECCYYQCKMLEINGISTDEIDTIIALVTEIIEGSDAS